MPSRQPLRIAIVGGSITGLTAAALLARIGAEVRVFERSQADLAGRGAGIVTHPEMHAILARLDACADPASLGVAVETRRVLDREGHIVGETRLPQVLASWGRLYGALGKVLPPGIVTLGANVVRIEPGSGEVALNLEDGRSFTADLVLGADGLFSTVRRIFAPEAAPVYAGYVAWRGLAEESELSAETRDAIADHFAFCLPKGEQILGYPVSGAGDDTRRGCRRFNFVWYRPAGAEELGRLLTDTEGTRHELSIPPNRIRPEVLSGMRSDAERLLAPAFAEVIRRTRQPFLQAILDLEAPAMAFGGRVAVIGDAAFVARPHVGMGVTKAMADASALADALVAAQGDVPSALVALDRARRPFGAAIVARSRALGAYMQAQQLDARQREDAERHRKPEAVLAETAVPPPGLSA